MLSVMRIAEQSKSFVPMIQADHLPFSIWEAGTYFICMGGSGEAGTYGRQVPMGGWYLWEAGTYGRLVPMGG